MYEMHITCGQFGYTSSAYVWMFAFTSSMVVVIEVYVCTENQVLTHIRSTACFELTVPNKRIEPVLC